MRPTALAPVLVVCDTQNDFLENDAAYPGSDAAADRSQQRQVFMDACRQMIDNVHKVRSRVIYACTSLRTDGLDSSRPARPRRVASAAPFPIEGTRGSQVVDGLVPTQADIVIRKTGHSAFSFTPLHRVLRNMGADSVILAGGPIYTSVNKTGRDAAALGYTAFAVREALFPFDYPHPEYLRMRTHLITLSDAIQRLSISALAEHHNDLQRDWTSLLNRSCLLLIDLQNGFVKREGFLAGAHELRPDLAFRDEDYRRLLANNATLIEWARNNGVPVINVRTVNRPDGADNALYVGAQFSGSPIPLRCVEGDWNAEYAEEIAPRGTDIALVKHGHDAFAFTILDRMLTNLGIEQCIVSGGNIAGCLEETLRGGSALGYSMVAVRDAAYRPGDPRIELMEDECEIVMTEDVVSRSTEGG